MNPAHRFNRKLSHILFDPDILHRYYLTKYALPFLTDHATLSIGHSLSSTILVLHKNAYQFTQFCLAPLVSYVYLSIYVTYWDYYINPSLSEVIGEPKPITNFTEDSLNPPLYAFTFVFLDSFSTHFPHLQVNLERTGIRISVGI